MTFKLGAPDQLVDVIFVNEGGSKVRVVRVPSAPFAESLELMRSQNPLRD